MGFLFLLVGPDRPPPLPPSSLFPFLSFPFIFVDALSFLDLCSPASGQFRGWPLGGLVSRLMYRPFYSTSYDHKVGRDALTDWLASFRVKFFNPPPFPPKGKKKGGERREGRFPSSIQPPPDHHHKKRFSPKHQSLAASCSSCWAPLLIRNTR